MIHDPVNDTIAAPRLGLENFNVYMSIAKSRPHGNYSDLVWTETHATAGWNIDHKKLAWRPAQTESRLLACFDDSHVWYLKYWTGKGDHSARYDWAKCVQALLIARDVPDCDPCLPSGERGKDWKTSALDAYPFPDRLLPDSPFLVLSDGNGGGEMDV